MPGRKKTQRSISSPQTFFKLRLALSPSYRQAGLMGEGWGEGEQKVLTKQEVVLL
jgi:hypothetical protein